MSTTAQELARAVQAEMRSILSGCVLHPPKSDKHHGTGAVRPNISSAQARAMLRIECSGEAFDSLMMTDMRSGFFDPQTLHLAYGAPRRFLGVTLYTINYDLPAPGWRVVNPMKVR